MESQEETWNRAVEAWEYWKNPSWKHHSTLVILIGIAIAFCWSEERLGLKIMQCIGLFFIYIGFALYLAISREFFFLAGCPCCIGVLNGLPVRGNKKTKMVGELSYFLRYVEWFGLKMRPNEAYAAFLDVMLRRGTIHPDQCSPGLIQSKEEYQVFQRHQIPIDQPYHTNDRAKNWHDRQRGRVLDTVAARFPELVFPESHERGGLGTWETFVSIPDVDNVGPIIRAAYE